MEKQPAENRPAHDPACYLCSGNIRANGEQTPAYEDVFVFTNDFSALLPDIPVDRVAENELFIAENEPGICRVLCFSPRHDLTVAEMERPAIRRVVDAWRQEYASLGALPYVGYVQVFENKGAIQGCSNPHPHGQIWAQEHIPDEPMAKQNAQLKYWNKHGRSLLGDYLAAELDKKERILFENEHFAGLIPFWAVWPFEAMLIPKRHGASIADLSESECDAFADAYKQLTVRYDNLFETSFPYSSGIHQAPTDGQEHREWHWHTVFYPPLLRSASVKKFMVGYETLAEPQRDITPEKAAEILRGVSGVHYKLQKV